MTLRRLLFTAAIGLNALLLFLVQPLAARLLLPVFGGSPAVWNVAMLFFETLLVGGYAYAHRQSPRRRPVHLALLAAGALAALLLRVPVLSALRRAAPDAATPVPLLLLGLLGLVGLPYFALSAGSPLLQRWFAATDDARAADPYFLYAASNVGSLGALLLYPLVLEPRLDLKSQWLVWVAGLLLTVVLIAFCLRGAPEADPVETTEAPKPTRGQTARWLALAAVPSVLVMGSTTYLTSNVAPIPLLWVVPLALYLLSFVFAFAARPLASSRTVGRAFALVATPLLLTLALESTEPLALLAGLHLLALFLASWTLHARLAESRPPASGLTGFYLTLSIGGALGGAFAALLAPAIFTGYAEYPLALVAALALRPPLKGGDDWKTAALYALLAALFTAAVGGIVLALKIPPSGLRTALAIGLPLLLGFLAYDRPKRMALMTGAAFALVAALGLSARGRVILARRSFFGVHRVERGEDHWVTEPSYNDGTPERRLVGEGSILSLVHGTTYHGRQDSRHPQRPLTYYHPTGPIGMLMRSDFGRRAKSVGLVGLGVGSLAAYAERGQSFTYFEIDPAVIAIAEDPRLFTFLRDARARGADVKVVPGDARLTLGRTADASFDLLVLDAFSSDAIPTHLLTREALALYARKLRPGGLIAFHISNRYLELGPTLAATAREVGLTAYDQLDGATSDEAAEGKTQSHWALLTRDPKIVKALGKGHFWDPIEIGGAKPWTDDHVDLLSTFHAPD